MKKTMISLMIILIGISTMYGDVRGLTTKSLFNGNERAVGAAPTGTPEIAEPNRIEYPFDRDEWETSDSMRVDLYLRAGTDHGMKFLHGDGSVMMLSQMGELEAIALEAIEIAPDWLEPPLRNVFSLMSPLNQERWAQLILGAQDPFIDEIAFCVAHTSVVYLESDYASPELFAENAELIYQIDQDLDYVEVIDYGTSVSDPDYYSTTQYQKAGPDDNRITIEVPRDIYYWYIVHPKITDDIPAYIDPTIQESNTTHINNIADPPDGVFWRDFLFYHADDGYPQLSEALSQVTNMVSDDGMQVDAIHAIQQWIQDVMDFTSGSERPHQPVRIYRKHMGRCGEHADITSAAARAALVPCTSVLSMSTDHTWNEFWDEGWTQWEPVNSSIDDPLVYENGWGKVFGTVFEIRSDGFLTSVTDRYSEGLASLILTVYDADSNPIDGARIILAIENDGMKSDMVAYTDENGQHEFIVGEGRTYYARIQTALGDYPENPDEYTLLREDAANGGEYTFQIPIDGHMPVTYNSPVTPPQDDEDDYRMVISFETSHQVLSGAVTWDDIDEVGERPIFFKEIEDRGTINCFTTTSDFYLFYQLGVPFESFYDFNDVIEGETLFDVPGTRDWCMFLDNRHRLNNAQLINGCMLFFVNSTGVGEESADSAPVFALAQNHPNPFNPETNIVFSIPREVPVRLDVFNIRGQKVCTLIDDVMKAGDHRITWQGEDSSGKQLGSGVYLYKLSTPDMTDVKKMIMLK